MDDTIHPPIFTATSTSVRQLTQLLTTIRFASKVTVTLNPEGLQFFIEESRVMQATVFLDRALFTSYNYTPSEAEVEEEAPRFQISLPALVETLAIFGASESSTKFGRGERHEYASNIRPSRVDAFSNQALDMTGICRLAYAGVGEPFQIILEESGVTTTCDLITYGAEEVAEIPFEKAALEVKIILQSRYLHDALLELSSMTSISGPDSRLKVVASPHQPFFSLSAAGALGSAAVEFSKGKELLETFGVRNRWVQYYRFEIVKQAMEAMKLASKVSLRGDKQGVLSLQFMVENEGVGGGGGGRLGEVSGGLGGSGGYSFVDFRFVPCVDEDQDEDEETEDDEDYTGCADREETAGSDDVLI